MTIFRPTKGNEMYLNPNYFKSVVISRAEFCASTRQFSALVQPVFDVQHHCRTSLLGVKYWQSVENHSILVRKRQDLYTGPHQSTDTGSIGEIPPEMLKIMNTKDDSNILNVNLKQTNSSSSDATSSCLSVKSGTSNDVKNYQTGSELVPYLDPAANSIDSIDSSDEDDVFKVDDGVDVFNHQKLGSGSGIGSGGMAKSKSKSKSKLISEKTIKATTPSSKAATLAYSATTASTTDKAGTKKLLKPSCTVGSGTVVSGESKQLSSRLNEVENRAQTASSEGAQKGTLAMDRRVHGRNFNIYSSAASAPVIITSGRCGPRLAPIDTKVVKKQKKSVKTGESVVKTGKSLSIEVHSKSNGSLIGVSLISPGGVSYLAVDAPSIDTDVPFSKGGLGFVRTTGGGTQGSANMKARMNKW